MSVDAAAVAPKRLLRFDLTERVVHWVNATGFLVLVATGASLKVAGLSTIVGNRHMVKTIHVWTGLLLPIPILLALAFAWGKMLRGDFKRFNRWSADDRRWWRRRNRGHVQLGKFNPGQKLNAVFIGAALVVQLGTGAIMYWFKPFPDSWRTGATFVHDSTWLVLMVVIAGHIIIALRDPDSMRSMLKGWVPQSWARRERPVWWAEQVAESQLEGAAGDVEGGA
jgi:formate dehydrogenase subunit gamma